jgi:CheY-like chemotaxis protein
MADEQVSDVHKLQGGMRRRIEDREAPAPCGGGSGRAMSHQSSSVPVVLVVEDEPLLRMMAADLVEEAGCMAIEATNADEAIALLESRGDIRVVFTDIDMPGSMDGLKLAAAIRDRWPPVEIIVTSGVSMKSADALPDRAVFFPKPYDQRMILATLHRMAELPSLPGL